jgi:hypothetical protein
MAFRPHLPVVLGAALLAACDSCEMALHAYSR